MSVRVAVLLGVLLSVATLAYVMYPLVRSRSRIGVRRAADGGGVAAATPVPRAVSDDEIEAAVRAYRDTHPGMRAPASTTPGAGVTCPTCGPRPERDASYCSSCGRPLTATEGR